MKLIYIAYRNVSVFDSQVVALMNHFANSDEILEIILILGINRKRIKVENIPEGINDMIATKFYRQYPQYPIFEQMTISSIEKTLKGIENINDYVIHVRNDLLSHYVYKALNNLGLNSQKILADIRGAGLEQMLEYSNRNFFLKKLKIYQRQRAFKSIEKNNHVSVVSNSLRKYVLKRMSPSPISISVNSCLANKSFKYEEHLRIITRDKLGLNKQELLFVLSTGGNNTWQNTDETIRVLAKSNYKILNLSKNTFDNPNVINLFVPYGDMPNYLCAADIAIMWREKSITNRVASPVKFSEFVACGLPVITNDSIDLVTEYIQNYNGGAIIDSMDRINNELVSTLIKLDRLELAKNGQQFFGIDTIAKQYINLYKQNH